MITRKRSRRDGTGCTTRVQGNFTVRGVTTATAGGTRCWVTIGTSAAWRLGTSVLTAASAARRRPTFISISGASTRTKRSRLSSSFEPGLSPEPGSTVCCQSSTVNGTCPSFMYLQPVVPGVLNSVALPSIPSYAAGNVSAETS